MQDVQTTNMLETSNFISYYRTVSSRKNFASAPRSFSLHIHFLQIIQRPTGTIWLAYKPPSTTTSTFSSWSQFLDCEIPPLRRSTPAILMVKHLSCHLCSSGTTSFKELKEVGTKYMKDTNEQNI